MKKYIHKTIRKVFGIVTVSFFLAMSIQAPVYAGMVSNSELNAAQQLELQRDEVRNLLARSDVHSYLQDQGVSESDLDERVNNMTDSEILAFHAEMDNLPAGEGFLGAVIAIIVIFMLLDIAGATDVFPGI